MRQHPEHVRSAILVAVAPTDLKMPLHHSESAARAMDLLLGECEQDLACHAAFPQIRDDWKNVLAQLEKQPARVQYSPPGKAAPTTVEIQRDVFAEKIRTWMYGRDKAARIPLIIYRAAEGDLAVDSRFRGRRNVFVGHVRGRRAIHQPGGSGEAECRQSVRKLPRLSTN